MLAGSTMCWGLNAVLSRFAVGEISPMLLVTGRWLGVIILAALFLRQAIAKDWPVLRQHFWFLVIMGTVGFTTFNALFYVAAHTTTALNIGIIQGAIPIFILIGAFLMHRTPVTPMQLTGVALTVIGVLAIASQGSLARLAQLAFAEGDLLMVVACSCYAAYAIGLRRRPKVSPLSIFSVMAAAAFVVSLPLTAVEYALGDSLWPSQTGWIVLGLVTIFPSFLAQIFFIQGVDRIGPSRAGVFANLVPVYAAVLAVLLLDEAFEWYHGLALGLVLSGIWLSERFKPKAA